VAMARAANLFLDISQHALVSIRVLNSSPLTKCQKPDRQGGPLCTYSPTGARVITNEALPNGRASDTHSR
jgi:hypothetical protein